MFFHVFSCFLPDVGWLLATDFSKGWKTSEFAQKVAPFALLLCQEAAFSPQNREAPRSTSVLLKSHLTRCFPMICPVKSNQFSDSKNQWVSVLSSGFPPLQGLPNSRTANERSHQLGKMGEDDFAPPCKEEEAKPARIWSAVRGAQIFYTSDF